MALSDSMRDFWVVAGTAAPVIALANQVAIGYSLGSARLLRNAGKDSSRSAGARKSARRASRWTGALYLVSLVNLAAQAAALGAALGTLADGHAAVSPRLEGLLVTYGLAAVMVSALLSGAAQASRAGMEDSPRPSWPRRPSAARNSRPRWQRW
jgi:hypothetical protein